MRRFVTTVLITVNLLLLLSGCVPELMLEGTHSSEVIEVTEEYYIFSPEYDSCYNSLKTKQKELYKKIYSICEDMPKGFIKLCRDYDTAVRDITIAYRAVLNDHTEIFWMPDVYIIGRNSDLDGKNICIAFNHTFNGNTAKYTVTRAERDRMRNELNRVVENVVKSAEKAESQFEKEKLFNDYICANTDYSDDGKLANTSYGCLVQKMALCEGYSRAFKLLCNKVGIECDLIVGKADGEGHMWNSVNIDGIHSFIDVTWNDRPDYPYFYFNITDEQLSFDHTISPLYSNVSEKDINSGLSFNFVERKCSYLGNGYYEKYGLVIDEFVTDFASKAADFIIESAEKGGKYADCFLRSEALRKEFLADENAFIAKIQKELRGYRINSYAFERDILVLYYE